MDQLVKLPSLRCSFEESQGRDDAVLEELSLPESPESSTPRITVSEGQVAEEEEETLRIDHILRGYLTAISGKHPKHELYDGASDHIKHTGVQSDLTDIVPGYTLVSSISDSLYRGFNTKAKQNVIVKFASSSSPGFISRMFNEWYILSGLNVSDSGSKTLPKDIKGILYPRVFRPIALNSGMVIIFDDVSNLKSLEERFMTPHCTDQKLILRTIIDATNILKKIHELGFTHNGLTSSNILINDNDEVYISGWDFSFAYNFEDCTKGYRTLNKRYLLDWLPYIAPEVSGEVNKLVDYRADFYSIGVILYELIVGVLPFSASDGRTLINKHICEIPKEPLSLGVPKFLSGVIMKLLAKSAEDRYSSAEFIIEDLSYALSGEPCDTDLLESYKLKYTSLKSFFGRDQEFSRIKKVYENLTPGVHILLITGQAGIGKTALVRELQTKIVLDKHLFSSWKCSNRITGLTSYISLLADMLHQILAGSEADVSSWRETILSAVNADLTPLFSFLPELEDLLGSSYQNLVSSQSYGQDQIPVKTELKLNHLLKLLLIALGKKYPLTIFFDDFQWFSYSDLELLRDVHYLIRKEEIESTLVVPVTVDTAFHTELALLKKKINSTFIEIELSPLPEKEVIDSLLRSRFPRDLTRHYEDSAGFKRRTEKGRSFHKILYKKAGGNPLKLRLMLLHSANNGMVFAGKESNTIPIWDFDLENIDEIPNDFDAMYANALRTSFTCEETEYFKYISCIFDKNSFSLNDLTIVTNKPLTEVAKFLSKAIKFELIFPLNIFYKFPFHLDEEEYPFKFDPSIINHLSSLSIFSLCHDTFHDFIHMFLMTKEEIREYHKRSGLRLLNSKGSEFIEQNIDGCLEIANHFCKSYTCVNSKKETDVYLKVLDTAYKFCYRANDFIPALKFLSVSKILLDHESNKSLKYSIHVEIASCLLMIKNYEGCINFIEKHGKLFQADPFIVLCKIKSLGSLGKSDLVVKEGVKCLDRAGFVLHIDEQWNNEHNNDIRNKIPPAITNIKSLKELKLANKKHSLLQEIMAEIIFEIIPQGKTGLAKSLAYTLVSHVAEHGVSGSASLGFLILAIIEMGRFKARAQSYSNFAVMLLKEEPISLDFANNVFYIYTWTIGIYMQPIHDILRFHDVAIMSSSSYITGYETTFIMNSCIKPILQIFDGTNIRSIYNFLKEAVTPSDLEDQNCRNWFDVTIYFVKSLLEIPKDQDEDIRNFPKFEIKNQSFHFKDFYYSGLCLLDGMSRKYDMFNKSYEEVFHENETASHSLFTPALLIFKCFVLEDDPMVHLETKIEFISKTIEELHHWRKNSPRYFDAKIELLQIELLKLEGVSEIEILDSYTTAAEKSEYYNIHYHTGMILERCGGWLYNISSNKTRAAQHLRDALKTYQAGGFSLPASIIKKRFPEVFEEPIVSSVDTSRRSLEHKNTINLLLSSVLQNDEKVIDILDSNEKNLDIVDLLKACLDISESMDIDAIIEKLVKHSFSLLGADYCATALVNEEAILEYRAVAGTNYYNTLYACKPNDIVLPDALIQHVFDTGNIVSNFREDISFYPSYRADTYFYKHHPKSLLCLPIKNEIENLGVLYFENRSHSDAFNDKKLKLVSLLCTQAAFTIDKSNLYSKMLLAKKAAEEATLEKATFLANMSHEIRTPFNSLFACAGFLLDTKLDPIQQEYVETIQSSSKVTLNIIDAILTFSKIEHGSLNLENEIFSLNDSIESSIQLLAEQASKKKLELVYLNKLQGVDLIQGDSTRFRQVIINLLGNAVKFTHRGHILLTASSEKVSSDNVYEITILVEDTGIGIPKNSHNKVFGAFSQVDGSSRRVYGGSGLGLAISKKLVDLMGGYLTFQSTEGVGTTFTMSLRSAMAPSKIVKVGKMHKRVIIIDAFKLESLALKTTIEETTNFKVKLSKSLPKLGELKKYDAMFLSLRLFRDHEEEILKLKDNMCIILLSNYGIGIPENFAQEGLSILLVPFQKLKLQAILKSIDINEDIIVSPTVASPLDRSELANTYPMDILVVEDNMVNTKVALLHLKKFGYKADFAVHGADALVKCSEKIKATGHNYNLIFMDIQMPVKDGLEASRDITELYGGTTLLPVIVALTANVDSEDREKCLNCGMQDFVSKPVLPEALERVIRTAGQSI